MTDFVQSNLLKLMDILEKNITSGQKIKFLIPEIWDTFNYSGAEKSIGESGIISVNPYKFYYECIKNAIIPHADPSVDYSKSLSSIRGELSQCEGYVGGDWISGSAVYGMQIRTTTSWDHDGSGDLELSNSQGIKDTGTFMKTIALLPSLKKMGIDAIYLLPISKNSTKYRKGEMGSPYAVKNFFELDPNLKDPMPGEEFTIDEEFGAFMEACHIMGIRVMIDIIPRTSARDSDLIFDNPDWFYWIRKSELQKYAPPRVEAIKGSCQPSVDNLEVVYSDKDVLKHLELFCESPDKLAPEKWKDIRRRCIEDKELDFFNLLEEEMGITTAPAFSDSINDPQPPWSDVTFLKLYMDYPEESQKYIRDNQAPYILFDIIKSNKFPGKHPNVELWNRIADIIPSYQRRFGIDGTRIDMGHALPGELEKMILGKPREIDPDFCFIAEVLGNDGADAARAGGYNMIIGNSWWSEPRISEGKFHPTLKQIPGLKAPVFVCSETPDTPRAAFRQGGRKLSSFVAVLNYFIPNGVPFISSGFEIYERQPMNMGLDVIPEAQFALPKEDPFYGKLAFFDRFQLHWTNDGNSEIGEILSRVSEIRKAYIERIKDTTNYLPVVFKNSEKGIGTSIIIEDGRKNLLMVIGNTDFNEGHCFEIDLSEARQRLFQIGREAEILYSDDSNEEPEISAGETGELMVTLGAGQIIVIAL